MHERLLSGYMTYPRLVASFSGFSVGFCINEERLSVTNFSSENNLPTFRLNAPVVPDDDWSIQSKCRQVISRAKVGNR